MVYLKGRTFHGPFPMWPFKVFLCLVQISRAFADSGLTDGRPNIVFFLVDDLGFNDVSFHGLTQIPTPNIDALASNGIILNNYYTAPACSPSRASLMSGLYPSTNGMQHSVIVEVQQMGLPLNNKTMAEYFKNDLGYETHIIGKWHLGFHKSEYLPQQRGFDTHYGFWNSDSDMFFHNTIQDYKRSEMKNIPVYETRDDPRLNSTKHTILFSGFNFRKGNEVVLNRQGEYLTDVYTEEAVRLIKSYKDRRRNKPMFLYLAHHGVHRGNTYMTMRAPQRYTRLFNSTITDNTRKNFAGALTAIDYSLGHVVAALDESQMLNNTIFVFSSDNGAPVPKTMTENGASSWPLRGGKMTAWEGGVRGNAFIWSPLLKKTGVYNGLMDVADWLPTLYSFAGGDTNDLTGPLDGKDMSNAIQTNGSSPRKEILHLWDNVWNMTGYRNGDFKIIKGIIPDSNYDGYFGDTGREAPPQEVSTTESETADVLRRFYKNDIPIKPQILKVDCRNGDNQLNYCNISTEYCLYNLKNDPCERNNIAKDNPLKVKEMVKQMDKIFKVDALNPQFDYLANPVYYSGFWCPWDDVDYNIHPDD